MNPQHRGILEKARQRLIADDNFDVTAYICVAIQDVTAANSTAMGYVAAGKELQRAIESLLAGRTTYCSYLVNVHGYKFQSLSEENARAARVAWIDYMLENW